MHFPKKASAKQGVAAPLQSMDKQELAWLEDRIRRSRESAGIQSHLNNQYGQNAGLGPPKPATQRTIDQWGLNMLTESEKDAADRIREVEERKRLLAANMNIGPGRAGVALKREHVPPARQDALREAEEAFPAPSRRKVKKWF